MKVGSAIKIKVDRWRGQIAKIIEILSERHLSVLDGQPTKYTSLIQPSQNLVNVRTIDPTDLLNRAKLQHMSQDLIISYGSTCLAIEGSPCVLTSFVERIQTNLVFVESIFKQVLESPESGSI